MLRLVRQAHAVGRLFGYAYVETPTFEHTELFARTAGETSDIVTKEMYTFQDKGDRSLTLRPEGTPGVVRAYLERAHDLPTPFKAYYVGSFFRHSRPQAGRLREFRQFGMEVIGDAGPGSDVEVIVAAHRLLRDRGVAHVLRLNSIGDGACRPAYQRLLLEYMQANADRLRDEHRDRFRANPLRVLDCKDQACREVSAGAPLITEHLCDACRRHFAGVRSGLEAEGVAFELDPRLVRGLDYYSRTAFELVSPALDASDATLCGGGRYDGLAEILGGPPTPGIGFGLGLDRVLLAMDGEDDAPDARGPACFVVAIGETARAAAVDLVRTLRDAGVASSLSFEDRPLKAQLRMADRAGAGVAAILGERELAGGTVTVRRLADGEQTSVPTTQLAEWLLRVERARA